MGSGISKTYPAGVLKPAMKHVRFGRVDVREYRTDRWESKPLLNPQETQRLEAKIRAAPYVPMLPAPRHQPPIKKPVKPSYGGLLVTTVAIGLFTTVLVAAAAGPFAVLVPVVCAAAFMAIKTYQDRSVKDPAVEKAKVAATQHLNKLALKYDRAGLSAEAAVYRNLAKTSSRSSWFK
jgi:hypothetical protein